MAAVVVQQLVATARRTFSCRDERPAHDHNETLKRLSNILAVGTTTTNGHTCAMSPARMIGWANAFDRVRLISPDMHRCPGGRSDLIAGRRHRSAQPEPRPFPWVGDWRATRR